MNNLNQLRWNDADIMTHSDLVLRPDASRTVIRPFMPGSPPGYDKGPSRLQRVADRVLALDQGQLASCVEVAVRALGDRHRGLENLLLGRFDEIASQLTGIDSATREEKLVIGAYFSEEYSYEAAALFNPSIVAHPDQTGAPEGGLRVVLSLRAVGEGHVSSLTFRSGFIAADGSVTIDSTARLAAVPQVRSRTETDNGETVELVFRPEEHISERVIFPVTPSQSNGIEDARFVEFAGAAKTYYATYTAYSGKAIRSELIETSDFLSFRMTPLNGTAARNKGMALFPRKLNGQYAMIARQDNENLYLIYSDDLYRWDGGVAILKPRFPWEFVQIGNCGAPIELDEGWLLLTHGVGPVRKYSIGAVLLDKADPSRVLARSREPLLRPEPSEREGYVPNVVYTCGAMRNREQIILPYAVSDTFCNFATISIRSLLGLLHS
jgi:predicted GH43/DUF377 family glycosyl hydrolase